ncbi:MAG: hypothetical protein M1820_006383 [Bogoriella megaspora]|nr:MAG: hypothetical protein M1820_006383 [Bogoriella megaspora]
MARSVQNLAFPLIGGTAPRRRTSVSQYGGAVVVNPGGPGGSGVSLVRRAGEKIQKVLDHPEDPTVTAKDSDEKYFDILSFDPRGVASSKPNIACFKDQSASQAWFIRQLSEGTLNSSDATLGRVWSMTQALGASCAANSDDEDIKRFVSTASVARDMLELVEKHGKWREAEARKEMKKGCPRSLASYRMPSALKSLRHRVGAERIQYWGFSYGSFLGSTFAAMFPDRIERLALDGVVDAEDYRQNLWYDNLVDTEKNFQTFFEHCASVGPNACPLAEERSTPSDIQEKVSSIISKLYHNPLPVTGSAPEVISYSDVRNLIFGSLYTPVQAFPYLANLLADIDAGNGTRFAELVRPYYTTSCNTQSGSASSINGLEPLRNGSIGLNTLATAAIACSDGDSSSDFTLSDFEEYWPKLVDLSPTIGEMWAELRLECTGWKIRPFHRYLGPYEAQTSHPILWISTTADPVTPLRSAQKMAKGFPGSRVLVQDSAGHCSLSSYSECIAKEVRRYFQTGKLPKEGTVCEADEQPWQDDRQSAMRLGEDRFIRLMEHRQVREAWMQNPATGGFMRGMLGGRIGGLI